MKSINRSVRTKVLKAEAMNVFITDGPLKSSRRSLCIFWLMVYGLWSVLVKGSKNVCKDHIATCLRATRLRIIHLASKRFSF